MDQDELLRRLDAHMERGNAIMARNNEVIARNELAFRANLRAFDDVRSYIADLTLVLQGLTREVGRMAGKSDEVIAEMRAQRQALFRMLDRLDGKGGEPGAAGA